MALILHHPFANIEGMKNTLLLLAVFLVLLSCKTKQIATTDDKTIVDSLAIDSLQMDSLNMSSIKDPIVLPKDLQIVSYEKRVEFFQKTIPQPNFENIKISSRISIEAESNIPSLDATIYIENNNKIWANMSVFFINAARALITPDGIKAYDKYNKNYIDSDFDYLNNMLNVNFIDYKSLQRILIGRTFLKINDRDFILGKTKTGYKMLSVKNQKMESDNATREYKIELEYTNDFNLIYARLKDVNSNDELELFYNDWSTTNRMMLPKNVKIIIKGTKNGQILIENTKFDFSKTQTPYSVPANYKKIEIQ